MTFGHSMVPMHASPKKRRENPAREELILDVARELLLDGGYHGLTMARIAEGVDYSKGTVYQHFACKEEVIIALATRSVEKQQALVERAALFPGRPRERMLAVAEATQLFSILYAADTRIFQIMNGEAITQKGTVDSLWRLKHAANHTVAIMSGIVRDAVAQGDLVYRGDLALKDLLFHIWLLGEAGKASAGNWLPPSELGISRTFESLIRSTQLMADAYEWRPLTTEWDYDESLRRIRKELFAEESKRAYGG